MLYQLIRPEDLSLSPLTLLCRRVQCGGCWRTGCLAAAVKKLRWSGEQRSMAQHDMGTACHMCFHHDNTCSCSLTHNSPADPRPLCGALPLPLYEILCGLLVRIATLSASPNEHSSPARAPFLFPRQFTTRLQCAAALHGLQVLYS